MRKVLLVHATQVMLLAPIAAALVVFGAACGGKSSDSGSSSKNSSAPAATTAPTVAAPQVLSLTALENGEAYSFNPKTLTAKVGTITIKMTNQQGDQRPHAFQVKALTGDTDIVKSDNVQPGESKDITFQVTAPGTYKFVCPLRGHEDRGMVGTLTVTGPQG